MRPLKFLGPLGTSRGSRGFIELLGFRVLLSMFFTFQRVSVFENASKFSITNTYVLGIVICALKIEQN